VTLSFSRLLLYLENLPPFASEFALDLAAKLSAKVFALYILDENRIKKRMREENKEREKVKEEMEEFAWQKLYEIEDLAGKKEVKIHLLLLEGKVSQILREVMESYEIGLLILSRDSQLNISRFLEQNREKGVLVL